MNSSAIDIDDLQNLLDFVFDGLQDISNVPSVQEYHKLRRIMRIMTRFYERGAEAKKAQRDECAAQLAHCECDLKMTLQQIDALSAFPDVHPKKAEYLEGFKNEQAAMNRSAFVLSARLKELQELYDWGLRVVDAMHWLDTQVIEYCAAVYKLDRSLPVVQADHSQPTATLNGAHANGNGTAAAASNATTTQSATAAAATKAAASNGTAAHNGNALPVNPLTVLSEELLKQHKRALDEVTLNLQESQDFFDASLDGRLTQYHQLHKCMIMAQLKVLQQFPADNPRRIYEEGEMKKDLEYVDDHLQESEAKLRHRQRMREMHRDFFRVLRWTRRQLKAKLGQAEATDAAEEAEDEAQRKLDDELRAANGGIVPVAKKQFGRNELPAISRGSCPVGKDKPAPAAEKSLFDEN